MSNINAKRHLFATTSPRTPALMVPDIRLLAEQFAGLPWDKQRQTEFMIRLTDADEAKGENLKPRNLDLAARDRINRSPKKFGLVKLSPVIELTPAGKALIENPRIGDVFLRQFLKYQLPSPLHTQTAGGCFRVKPYLELFRLVRTLGTLTFDEMRLFGLQLTDYRLFDDIVSRIETFRNGKAQHKGSYKSFVGHVAEKTIREIYAKDIARGNIHTRESATPSVEAFVAKKERNMRDYADAIFRHLRATEMVELSQSGRSLSIAKERLAEVDFFLSHINREPLTCVTEADYISYLGDKDLPQLLTDDRQSLVQTLQAEFPELSVKPTLSTCQLADILAEAREMRKADLIEDYIDRLKRREEYEDIVNTFKGVREKAYYDCPLMFEWNTWRAMTMLNGGKVRANLKFDDMGRPVSTAVGNVSDIECDYGTFGLTVEVTLTSGQRQFFTESEPVPRHLGKYKETTCGRQAYGLFIAPKISPATVAHFYGLRRLKIDFYGGDTVIVPLELSDFETMLGNARRADYTPSPAQVEVFFKQAMQAADESEGGDAPMLWWGSLKGMASRWPQL